MGGLSEIDVDDWKRHTEYRDYVATEQPVVWFWKVLIVVCVPLSVVSRLGSMCHWLNSDN